MASSYSTRKRLEKQNPGENNNAWGGYLNSNMIDLVDECFGVVCVAMTTAGDSTLSKNNGLTDEGRRSQIILTGVPTSNVRLFVPAAESFYIVRNKMTGTKKVTITNTGGTNGVDFSGSGSGAEQGLVVSDGTNVREVLRTTSVGGISGFTSVVWTAVSDAPTDTTGGAVGDFVPFLDISEGQALNKVTVQKFFDNALAGMSLKTSVGTTDQVHILDADTSTSKMVTAPVLLAATNALTAKTTPVTADVFPMMDSAASNVAKKVTYGNILTTMTATQAQLESASATTVFVTPGRQHFHPAHFKAFGFIDGAVSTGNFKNSYGLSTFTDLGVGTCKVDYTTAFTSTGYGMLAVGRELTLTGWGIITETSAGSRNTSYYSFNTWVGNFGSNTQKDLGLIEIGLIGDFV